MRHIHAMFVKPSSSVDRSRGAWRGFCQACPALRAPRITVREAIAYVWSFVVEQVHRKVADLDQLTQPS